MIMKDAQRRGLIAVRTSRPIPRIGAAKRHKAKIKAGVDFPMPGEVRAMLDDAGPKAKAMVALAALAGLRAASFGRSGGRTSSSAPVRP